MLSNFAQVSAEGQYKQPPHAKLSYGGVRRFYFPPKTVLTTCTDAIHPRKV